MSPVTALTIRTTAGGNMPETMSKNSMVYSRFLIGKARHFFVAARQQELAPFQISPRQAHVLTLIEYLGDKANLTELAERTERNINTLSIQMTKLENDGLVVKIKDAPKSNKLRFELTEKGLNICKAIKTIKSAKVIMSALSEEERQQLISLLEKVINQAQKYY
jgi:DNA-binding MarR family transcriptional regulator